MSAPIYAMEHKNTNNVNLANRAKNNKSLKGIGNESEHDRKAKAK